MLRIQNIIFYSKIKYIFVKLILCGKYLIKNTDFIKAFNVLKSKQSLVLKLL